MGPLDNSHEKVKRVTAAGRAQESRGPAAGRLGASLPHCGPERVGLPLRVILLNLVVHPGERSRGGPPAVVVARWTQGTVSGNCAHICHISQFKERMVPSTEVCPQQREAVQVSE